MRKKLTVITLVASLTLMNGIFTHTVFAENSSDLDGIQSERKEIQKNLSVQEQKVNELFSEIDQLNEEVTHLNEQVLEKRSEVEGITEQIDTTVDEIEILQEEIEILEASIEERFEILKTRASSYQKTGGAISYMEVLFGAKDFGDFISRLTAVNQIVDSDTKLMDELDKDMKTVEEHRLTTMGKLDELNEMHLEKETQLTSIEEEKALQEDAKQAVQDKQQELIVYVEELQLQDADLKSMEDNVKAEIAAIAKQEKEAEERRIAEAEQVKAKKQEKVSKEKSNLVHVSKVETKSNSSSNSTSTKPAPKESKESFNVTSTAYTANCAGCSGITSTGIDLNSNPNQKVIAVDPNVIPLNSVVHVEGYGFAIAGDTGSAIKGKKIDVFVPTNKAALNWGVKTVKVTIQ